ncbi:MAG: NfeD family protein [Pigmentiphaga sp.]
MLRQARTLNGALRNREFLTSWMATPWVWLIGGVLVAGLEIFAVGSYYLIWIGLAMIVTGIGVGLYPAMPLSVQLLVLIAGILGTTFAGVRAHSRSKRLSSPTINLGLARYRGKEVRAVGPFVNGRGRVRVGDTTYAARCNQAADDGQILVVDSVQDGEFHVALNAEKGPS